MKVLVTGGAGFIGSHIADRLIRDGHSVRILDNLEPRVHKFGEPYISDGAEFIKGDVRSKDDWINALDGVDVVFHEAAYQDYMPDYSKFFNTNVTSTALIYEVIKERSLNVKKVIVASSQAAYGPGQYECKEHGFMQPPPRPLEQLNKSDWEQRCSKCGSAMKALMLKEDYANPYNQYAISKYAEELTALRLGLQIQVPSIALRYSIVQGPRQSLHNQYSGICRIFTFKLLNNQQPIIFEDGEQTRDFVHIDDVVEANMTVLKKKEADYQAFNVGSGYKTTINRYTSILTAKMKKEIKPKISGEYRLGDNRDSVSDPAKLMSLGWKPRKSLENIFEDYLAWVQSLGDISKYFSDADVQMRQSGVVRAVKG